MEKTGITSVRRLTELGGRTATLLDNQEVRVLISDRGGMIPELSAVSVPGSPGRINAHWNPWFRGNGMDHYQHDKHGAFWKASLLYNLTGNFPCLPNFGPGHMVDGIEVPPHGWSANELWRCTSFGSDETTAWAVSFMEMGKNTGTGVNPFPLRCTKIDAVIAGQSVHYTDLIIENTGDKSVSINVGWHNTVGAPFLETGCRISACAETWHTAPEGGEFDDTGRLVLGKPFETLAKAPLRSGGTTDLSLVPPPIGYTDLVSGKVPAGTDLGWSAVVNPHQQMVYICFFPGPGAAEPDEIALTFNNLWMQYGGRSFTPWAPYEGGTDMTYCLGTENSVGAFANGLGYARNHPTLMGNPTLVEIPAREKRVLRYGTLFAPYTTEALSSGIAHITGEREGLRCKAAGNTFGETLFRADPTFSLLKRLEKSID